MTARYPLVRVGADISELPAGDTLLGVSGGGSTDAVKMHQLIKNNTGVTLLKGQAVYIDGATGVNVTVALAQANTESTSSKTLGLIEADILNGSTGYVVTEGELINFNTSAATNEGDSVWLSPTVAGGLVYGLANKPVAPNHMVYLGVVSRKNINNGVILVKVQNGYELNELHNVLISSISDTQLLKYDSVTSLWKNDVITYSEISGTVPTWNQNTTGNAANVTGIVAIANGGTGATTLAGANLPVTNVANVFINKNTFSGSTSALAAVFNNAAETTLLTSTAPPAAITFDINAQSVSYYYNTVSANNWTINFRHSSGTTLNTAMAIGQTVTVTIMVTNSTTAYYNSGVSIDGTALTAGTNLYWQGGTSPSGGNPSSVDMYTYAIVKTAANTFKVFAAQTKFA